MANLFIRLSLLSRGQLDLLSLLSFDAGVICPNEEDLLDRHLMFDSR